MHTCIFLTTLFHAAGFVVESVVIASAASEHKPLTPSCLTVKRILREISTTQALFSGQHAYIYSGREINRGWISWEWWLGNSKHYCGSKGKKLSIIWERNDNCASNPGDLWTFLPSIHNWLYFEVIIVNTIIYPGAISKLDNLQFASLNGHSHPASSIGHV